MNSIELAVRVDLLLYALLINIIMIVYINVNHKRKEYSETLFQWALLSVSILIVAEAISWIYGEFGNRSQIAVHYWSNAIYLGLIPLPGCVGLAYFDYKIFHNKKSNKTNMFYYFIPVYIGIFSVIYNFIKPGFLFYIDSLNEYHRGPFVYSSAYIMYAFMIIVFAIFYRDKKTMTSRVFRAMGIFILTPVTGIALQLKAYGTSLSMPSHTIALLLIFLILERDKMMRDPLTSLYTRHNFEMRLREKIKRCESFSLILVDLNDFKFINDNFGHLEGDKVLQLVSEVLLKSTNIEDLVCRYGGDEFFILVEHDYEIMDSIIHRIDNTLDRYNSKNNNYKISLSYGKLFVNENNTLSIDELIHEVDRRMYEDKDRRKI